MYTADTLLGAQRRASISAANGSSQDEFADSESIASDPDSGDLAAFMLAVKALEDISRAADQTAKLRACGFRLVAAPETLTALRLLAKAGNPDAARVLASVVPRGHREVIARPGGQRRWVWQRLQTWVARLRRSAVLSAAVALDKRNPN